MEGSLSYSQGHAVLRSGCLPSSYLQASHYSFVILAFLLAVWRCHLNGSRCLIPAGDTALLWKGMFWWLLLVCHVRVMAYKGSVTTYMISCRHKNSETIFFFFVLVLEYSVSGNIHDISVVCRYLKFRLVFLITWDSNTFSGHPAFSSSLDRMKCRIVVIYLWQERCCAYNSLPCSSWSLAFLMTKNVMLFYSKVECYFKEFILVYQKLFRVK